MQYADRIKRYTLEELRDAQMHLDRSQFPDRYDLLCAEIQLRLEDEQKDHFSRVGQEPEHPAMTLFQSIRLVILVIAGAIWLLTSIAQCTAPDRVEVSRQETGIAAPTHTHHQHSCDSDSYHGRTTI